MAVTAIGYLCGKWSIIFTQQYKKAGKRLKKKGLYPIAAILELSNIKNHDTVKLSMAYFGDN